MKLAVEAVIDGPKEKVWELITDIENSKETISGIEKIEVLEKPAEGLVGLKWRETRTMFGREATEIMWITDAKEHESYRVRAENSGAIYLTAFQLAEQDAGTRLTMEFEAQPQTFVAKLMSALTGRFFKNATQKALEQDLLDIKRAVEQPA